MYIYRTYKLKMRILQNKRIKAGLQPKYIQRLDVDWCMKNQDFLTDGNDVDEQNSKIIMTKAQAAQYKLDMDEDWPYGISND